MAQGFRVDEQRLASSGHLIRCNHLMALVSEEARAADDPPADLDRVCRRLREIVEEEPGKVVRFGAFMKRYSESHGPLDVHDLGFSSLPALLLQAGLRRSKRGGTSVVFAIEGEEAQVAAGQATEGEAAAEEAVFLLMKERQGLVREALASVCEHVAGNRVLPDGRVELGFLESELKKLGLKIDGLKTFLCNDPLLLCSSPDGGKAWYVSFKPQRTKQDQATLSSAPAEKKRASENRSSAKRLRQGGLENSCPTDALPEDEEALQALGAKDLARLLRTDADGLTLHEMRTKLRRLMLGAD